MHRAVIEQRCPYLAGNLNASLRTRVTAYTRTTLTAATDTTTAAAATHANTVSHIDTSVRNRDGNTDVDIEKDMPVAELQTELHAGMTPAVLAALVHFLYTDR